ncbi:MAG TPA: DoxX family protein [Rhizomicrobium sp.]|nr:DoxX family protein [Rhizomicrobium sp.]
MQNFIYDPAIPAFIAWTIASLFAASGLVQLAGPAFVQRAYARWKFPPKFYRVTGGLELLAALFLASPITRIWGVAIAAIVTFMAVVTLLNHRQYAYTVPGILLMIGLVPASLTTPF